MEGVPEEVRETVTHDEFRIKKSTVKFAALVGAFCTVMTIGGAWGLAAAIDDNTESETQAVVLEVRDSTNKTNVLVCSILAQAENPDIRAVVREICPTIITPLEP